MNKPNWQQTIKEINATGMTYREICAVVGCGQGTLGDLATGATKEATYTFGAALIDLHRRKVLKVRGPSKISYPVQP